MAENSKYFDAVVANRSVLLSEEEALTGAGILSIETQEDLAPADLQTYLQDSPAGFFQLIRYLKFEDQELLLAYYLLGKSQNTLALASFSTQTICSFRIRMAETFLAAILMFGGLPSEEQLRGVFESSGHEDRLKGGLSKAVSLYLRKRSFAKVGEMMGVHRPDIRRAFSEVNKELRESTVPRHRATGVLLFYISDKSSATGTGASARQQRKLNRHLYVSDIRAGQDLDPRLDI